MYAGVFDEYLPAKSVNARGEKTVWLKSAGREKERFTAMLLTDGNGNKLAPFPIFKILPSIVPDMARENIIDRHVYGRRLWVEIEPL